MSEKQALDLHRAAEASVPRTSRGVNVVPIGGLDYHITETIDEDFVRDLLAMTDEEMVEKHSLVKVGEEPVL